MRMVVADLMCESPVTITPNATCVEALESFYEFEAAELYVVDRTGRLLGVLPDYELLRAELNGEALDALVCQLMSTNVRTLTPETDAATAARLLRDSHFSRVPVVKSGRLIGVITRSDLLRVMAVLCRMNQPVERHAPKRPKMISSKQGSEGRSHRPSTLSRQPIRRTTVARPASRKRTATIAR